MVEVHFSWEIAFGDAPLLVIVQIHDQFVVPIPALFCVSCVVLPHDLATHRPRGGD